MRPRPGNSAGICVIGKYRMKTESVINQGFGDYFSRNKKGREPKFRARIDDWILEKKLFVCFLPTYSPELNMIEILWRKVKYEWLNLLSITDFKEFK